MACYQPLYGYYARDRNETGKRSLVFTLSDGYADRPISVPCGSCIGCRLERARQWSVRCMHEAKLYEDNQFVTLTYEDSKLHKTAKGLPTLNPRDMVLFLKRLRKRYGPGIRFFQCGEYGDQTVRPHHHALLFNLRLEDRKFHGHSGSGEKLYVSKSVDDLWGNGHCWIGSVSFESAGYIARYTMKKCGNDWQDKDPVLDGRYREYLTMSRRPGIGHGWAMKYGSEWYKNIRDEVVVNGVSSRPPRYYDSLAEKRMPCTFKAVKLKRIREGQRACERNFDVGVSKFAQRVVKESAIKLLKREDI